MSGAISEYADQLAQTGDGDFNPAHLWPKQGYPDLRPLGDVVAAQAQEIAELRVAANIAADLHNAHAREIAELRLRVDHHAREIAELRLELQARERDCDSLQSSIRYQAHRIDMLWATLNNHMEAAG